MYLIEKWQVKKFLGDFSIFKSFEGYITAN